MPASPLRIAVTGAAGQVGYGLPFRHHYCLKIGVAGSGEDLLQDPREALKRQLSGAEQVTEPRNGRDLVIFVCPVQRRCNREVFVHGPILVQRNPEFGATVRDVRLGEQCRRGQFV